MESVAFYLLAAAVLLAREAAPQPTAPTTSPENYDFIFSSPSGCAPSSCAIFAGVNLNQGDSNYVDIYLEGAAGGYVAVGFSASRNMFNADVVACTRDSSNNMIQALDAWNPAGRSNQVDSTGTMDVMLFSGSFVNGRIRCSVAKRIIGSDSSQDINLNTDLYMLYAFRSSLTSPTTLRQHGFSQRGFSLDQFSFPPIAATDPPPTTPTTEAHTTPTTEAQTTPTTDGPTTEGPMTTAGTTSEPTTQAPQDLVAPTTSPENYDFIFSSSPGCAPSSCTIFAGVNLNQGDSNYVDIYLEGAAGGYVAVGFSATPNMFNADVVACTRDSSNNMIQVLDTWNPAGRSNQVDSTGTMDVMLFSGSFVNGRIRCSVAKRIIGSDSSQDINLNTNLYMLYASRSSLTSPTVLRQHGPRAVSQELYSFPPIAATDPPPTTPTTEGPTTPSTGTTEAPLVAPTIQPADYRLIFREPAGCNASECDIFVGIDTNTGNSDYLDIYLEGQAGGWVAVGFSETQQMFSADVVACNRDPMTGDVEALDTRNFPSPQRGSPVDAQRDIMMFSSEAQNGRIRCIVAKHINSGDTDGDNDLDNSYYVLYARRQANSVGGALTRHMPSERFISANTTNPVRDGGTGAGTGISAFEHHLIRAHGILMMIAWTLISLSAIYFSTWMKGTLPNGEWFQIHRALMVASLLIALLGFMLIFIANKDNATPGLIDLSSGTARVHFAFGIIITAFQIANPIIALFRCKPDHSKRWIFKLIHGSLAGRIAESFSLTNVALGLSLFSDKFAGYSNRAAFWLYIAFIIFYVIFIIVNIIVSIVSWKMGAYNNSSYSCQSKKSTDHQDETELKTMKGEDSEKSDLDGDTKERKTPAKDAPVHWAFFAVLMVVLIPVVIALIVLVALPQE